MEPTPPPPESDLEFRTPAEPRPIAAEPYLDAEHYQRLVANPFLGLLGFLAWLWAVRWLMFDARFQLWLPALLLVLAAGVGLPFLFQFHCRDCGASGRLSRWRKHTCPAILERRRTGRPLRFRGPTPSLQVVIWLYVLLLIGIIGNALGWPALAIR